MNLVALLGLGLVLGIRHASDPDHVVAVIAIASRTRSALPAALLGAIWGLGHSITLLVVGAAIILFNVTVPARVGLAFELAVALTLVVVGALNLGHRHRPEQHVAGDAGPLPAKRAFATGIVHGLAGSAGVTLLVLSLVRDPLWACGYLALFAAGTMVGMMLVTAGFARPWAILTGRWPDLGHHARFATGALSIAFGLWLAWRIGAVDGLFTAAPRWTPH